MSSKIVVIGNGPSLRGFNFEILSNVDTLGMNAAYRYWDRVNWYPDHYCCLDIELINTHYQAIKRLVDTECVKTAFLSAKFLEYFPETAQDHRYVFREQFSRQWCENVGVTYGLNWLECPAFKSSSPSKVTTGAYSVRYAIYLGYKAIGLIGIDLKYVEQIPEATRAKGLKLVIKQTPNHNPNYFFDDYQQQGDSFQVPNPEIHDFDLHPVSFEVLRNDLIEQRLRCSIYNCNPSSELHKRGIFPYTDLFTFVGKQKLDALVILTQVNECERIVDNFRLWQLPDFIPFLQPEKYEKLKLIFTFTGKENEDLKHLILEEFRDSLVLQECFNEPEFIFFELAEDEDIYIRDYQSYPPPKLGFKSGPNQQFFRSLFALHPKVNFAYFMETDCLPIRPDWLGKLCDLVQNSEEFWILGSPARGKSYLSKWFARHINGSAIYAVGDRRFIDIAKEWQTILNDIVQESNKTLAYDCTLEYFLTRSFALTDENDGFIDPHSIGWQLFQETATRVRSTEFILNYSNNKDSELSEASLLRKVRSNYKNSYVVHSKPLCNYTYKKMLTPESSKKSSHLEKPQDCDRHPSESSLIEQEKELLKRHPLPQAIFQPTQKYPLSERIDGLKRVIRIYEERYHAIYLPRLEALKNRFKGFERAFIIGNGPSLNQTNLELLKNEVTFGVNGIFLKFPETDFRPTFYVVEDHLVAEDRRDQINKLKGMVKLFPIYLAYCLDESEETIFYDHRPRHSYPDGFDFSVDASKRTYAGCTVTFSCLQLAFYLGFKEIYLVGVDCDYQIPKNIHEKEEYSVKILDMETNDPNHFDPSYFGKGYRWHDPQVDKMQQAYQEAKRVYEAYNRTVYNATVGGKLEVFPRIDYYSLFSQENDFNKDSIKILIIDITRIGDQSATGQMKQSLFGACSGEALLQVYVSSKDKLGLYSPSATVPIDKEYSVSESQRINLLMKCLSFKPDVVYYRPVAEHPHFHDFACALIEKLDVPTVMHIVDDWPERLRYQDPSLFVKFDASLRNLFGQASACMSICRAMSVAFKERYGVDFLAFANSIRPEEWAIPQEINTSELATANSKPFTIRYLGSLATDMTRESVLDVAKVVQDLQRELPVELEIYTTRYWKDQIYDVFSEYTGVTVHDAQFGESYRQLMMSADALLIAYNFDEESIRYVRYSIANKLPECLASGKVTIVYGPVDVATVAYAAEIGCTQLTLNRDLELLKESIRELIYNPQHREELGQKAREYAFTYHDATKIQVDFYHALRKAAASKQNKKPKGITSQLVKLWKAEFLGLQRHLFRTFSREEHASINETQLVAEVFKRNRTDSKPLVMFDVGAHFGSAIAPFVDQDWYVYAFEPDPTNREQLAKKYGECSNIVISELAVGDCPGKTVSLYSSDESTGISTLAPFRDSHKPKCQVTTTTIQEVCEQSLIGHIDFLKIDTEGLDLMVLQGVPWQRIKPKVIECEFEDRKTVPLGYTFDDLAQYLLDRGYTVLVSEWHPVIRYGIKHDWYRLTTYPCQLASPDAWGNLLAFKEPPDLTEVAAIAQRLVKTNPAATTEPATPSMLTSSSQSSSPATKNGAGAFPQRHSATPKRNGRVETPAQPVVTHVAEQPAAPLPTPPTAESTKDRGAYLLQRIARYYRRWPLGVAVLAVTCNCLGMVESLPFRWAFTGGGSALTLFLVGHAATRSDRVIESAQSTADEAKTLATGANNKVSKTTKQQQRIQKNLKRVRRIANQAQNHSARLKEQLGMVKATALSANRTVSRTNERIAQLEEITQTTAKNGDKVLQVTNQLVETVAQVTNTAEQANQTARQATESANRVTNLFYRSNISNAALFQPFGRHLSNEHIDELVKAWLPALNLQLDRQALGYLAHQVCLIEDACAGRLATTVEDMLLRILVARSVQSQGLSVLEIGALFGINLGILYESCRGYFETIHLTALDPLDGYYAQSLFDKITQVPVNRDTFSRNMRRLDIPTENITLIQALSTDDEALTIAGQNQYNLLVIDGDHSYTGVKFDFDHYLAALDVGGYIIFDDYATEHWPEVAHFVDKEVRPNPCVEFIGASWRTAVFRVVRRNLK